MFGETDVCLFLMLSLCGLFFSFLFQPTILERVKKERKRKEARILSQLFFLFEHLFF